MAIKSSFSGNVKVDIKIDATEMKKRMDVFGDKMTLGFADVIREWAGVLSPVDTGNNAASMGIFDTKGQISLRGVRPTAATPAGRPAWVDSARAEANHLNELGHGVTSTSKYGGTLEISHPDQPNYLRRGLTRAKVSLPKIIKNAADSADLEL